MSLIRKLRDRLQAQRCTTSGSKRAGPASQQALPPLHCGLCSARLRLHRAESAVEPWLTRAHQRHRLSAGRRTARAVLRRHRRAAGRLDHRAQCSCQPFQCKDQPPRRQRAARRGLRHVPDTDWESLQQFHSGDLLSRINTDVSNVAGSVLGWIRRSSCG